MNENEKLFLMLYRNLSPHEQELLLGYLKLRLYLFTFGKTSKRLQSIAQHARAQELD
jgi:hypothetical protein